MKTKNLPPRAYVIVKDESLQPLFRLGDLVMLDTTLTPYHGCFVIAKTKYGMVMRQYLQKGDWAILRSLNTSIPDILFQQQDFIGIVIDVIRK